MIKVGAIVFLGTLAAASQAIIFNAVSVGTTTSSSGSGYVTTESLVFQNTPAPLSTLTFTAILVGNGAVGNLSYTGTGGAITLSFTSTDFVVSGNSASTLNGTWTVFGGIGGYSAMTGSGTFAAVYNFNGGHTSTTVAGNLNAVPEPATLAVLGFGALVAARRRRRS